MAFIGCSNTHYIKIFISKHFFIVTAKSAWTPISSKLFEAHRIVVCDTNKVEFIYTSVHSSMSINTIIPGSFVIAPTYIATHNNA